LIRFSRWIADYIVACCSNHTRIFTSCREVNPTMLPSRCWAMRCRRC